MKLFIEDRRTRQKHYLKIQAHSREDALAKIGTPHFTLAGQVYNVGDIRAEPDSDNATAGAVIGGLVGLVGGPWGVLAGGALGILFGNQEDQKDKALVERFNRPGYGP